MKLDKKAFAALGVGYIVSLAATFTLATPSAMQLDLIAPAFSAASIMLFCGPYLLVTGCTKGFLPSPSALLSLAVVLPFYIAHLCMVLYIVRRTQLAKVLRIGVVAFFAVVSAIGVWSELPRITRYDVPIDDKLLPPDGIRIALVTDLHSCRYGKGQNALIRALLAEQPDAVFLSGDIFDDREKGANAQDFVRGIAKTLPCFYIWGNHEHWSERIPEIRDFMLSQGVTVLESNVATVNIRGKQIDVCGIDDPTYIIDFAWLRQIERTAALSNPSRLKLLLAHRPEYAGIYARYGFDVAFSGHLHGGQWRIPFLNWGVCAPLSGGPNTDESRFFPKRAGGVYAIGDKMQLVVSRGLARESTPLPRFFNNPEFIIARLVPV